MLIWFSNRDSVGWLARSASSGERSAMSLKTGVGAQGVVIVLVRVPGEDAEDARLDCFREGMADASGIALIVKYRSELLRESDALVELPQEQEAGIGGDGGVGHPDLKGQRLENIEAEERSRAWGARSESRVVATDLLCCRFDEQRHPFPSPLANKLGSRHLLPATGRAPRGATALQLRSYPEPPHDPARRSPPHRSAA
jgi:hypothetical protein